jgi:hypothetical protein
LCQNIPWIFPFYKDWMDHIWKLAWKARWRYASAQETKSRKKWYPRSNEQRSWI